MRITLMLLALIACGGALAADDTFVTDIKTKTLYVYDQNGDEIDKIKADVVRKEFKPVPAAGADVKGILIQEENAEEGLVEIALSKYPQPVWIETMAVEIWPGNRLKCPDVTVGRPEIEQSGMTIGFGGHCEDAGESTAEE